MGSGLSKHPQTPKCSNQGDLPSQKSLRSRSPRRSLTRAKFPHVNLGQLTSENNAHTFTEDELATATNNYKLVVGSGGFGTVYRGVLVDTDSDESLTVAVKVLHNASFDSSQELLTEMVTVAGLRHPYTLRLIGYCIGESKALVYDYMAGGDVDSLLLKCRKGQAGFPWENRMQVAYGCAVALAFMHSKKVIHRDFKASNVLLSKELSPRVADFGLAKALNGWQSHVTTRIKGSIGYIDPLYFVLGHVHAKSDVYAFGVFLVELVTAKSVYRDSIHDTVIPEMTSGTPVQLQQAVEAHLDPSLGPPSPQMLKQALALAGIAKQAFMERWEDRPSMEAVVRTLKRVLGPLASDEPIELAETSPTSSSKR